MEEKERILNQEDKIWIIETTLKSNSYEKLKSQIKEHFEEEKQMSMSAPILVETPAKKVREEVPSPRNIDTQTKAPLLFNDEQKVASIYAAEHRNIAMAENNIGITKKNINNEDIEVPIVDMPKAKVLEPVNRSNSKVVYSDIKTVVPGQFLNN